MAGIPTQGLRLPRSFKRSQRTLLGLPVPRAQKKDNTIVHANITSLIPINHLRIFSVMITDWETNFTDLQANEFGNLGNNNSGNIPGRESSCNLYRN